MDPCDPQAPVVTLSTASAQIIEGGSNFTVLSETKEGNQLSTTFVDADVDMPIMSGAVLCEDESDILITKNGGLILHADGRKSHFVKRRGVYFMQIWVKKALTQPADVGFVRPGSA